MKKLTTKVRQTLSPMRWASRFVERLCCQESVQQGPFSGMQLSFESSFTSIRPLLLGAYEMELWQQIRQAVHVCDGSIVVGAAEGYYAIGITKLADGKKVIAFEMDPNGLRLLQANAEKNKVEQRLEIFGKCDGPALRNAVKRFAKPFVIIDVEGAELEILVEADGSVLDQSILLVEIHDFVDRSLGETIRARFEATHSLTEIWQRPRHPLDLPESLPFRRILWRWYRTLISESRPEKMRWFFLTPKSNNATEKSNGVSALLKPEEQPG